MSGMPEPELKSMGINTSFEDFSHEKDFHESMLSETIAKLYGVDSKNVIITTGASEAIFIVYSTFCKDRAIVPLPNYEPMFSIPESLGMQTLNKLDQRYFSDGVMVGITNPNNPTGSFKDDDYIFEIAKSISKYNGILFNNETYREFKFDSPFARQYRMDNVVVCSSLTKFYGLGRLRIGWIVADDDKSGKLLKAKRLISGHSSEYAMWIARQVLENRKIFIKRVRGIMQRNMKLLKNFVQNTSNIEVNMPEAAPFCLVKYKGKRNSVSFSEELLKKTGILVSPGDFFGMPNSFRLCITLNEKKLAEGLDILSDYMNKG
jgi:aspartate/methionine/tyrosine aminotransferase